jgi:hypothetical protein
MLPTTRCIVFIVHQLLSIPSPIKKEEIIKENSEKEGARGEHE